MDGRFCTSFVTAELGMLESIGGGGAMRTRSYDWTVNLTLFLAIASAILFERIHSMNFIAGIVAILAGTTAVCIYFYNQFHGKNSEGGTSVGVESHTFPSHLSELLQRHVSIGRASNLEPSAAEAYLEFLRAGHTRWDRFLTDHIATAPPQEKFADQIVQIINKLSVDVEEGSSFEFVLSKDGNFTIRQPKRDSIPVPEEAEGVHDAKRKRLSLVTVRPN